MKDKDKSENEIIAEFMGAKIYKEYDIHANIKTFGSTL